MLLSDCLVSYPGHSLGESYPTAEMQSVYSAASVDRAKNGIGDPGLNLVWVSFQPYAFAKGNNATLPAMRKIVGESGFFLALVSQPV